MKKHMFICLIVAMILLFTMFIPGYARSENSESLRNETCEDFLYEVYGNVAGTPLEVIGKTISINEFGGAYVDKAGNYVVNVTDLGQGLATYKARQNGDTENVTFAQVKYSLSLLENAVELLIPYMRQYKIQTLDANDITNQLDVCLSDYSEENREHLTALINKLQIPNDCVNYIDQSGAIAEITVGRLDEFSPDDQTALENVLGAEAMSGKELVPGQLIVIGQGVYSLGPYRKNIGRFLSAGHLTTKNAPVKLNSAGYPQIGNISSTYFSGNRDISTIALTNGYAQHQGFSYNYYPAQLSTQISMVGGTTGISNGSITAVNAVVNYEAQNVTLRLSVGSYKCAPGDSGAPIFNQVSAEPGTLVNISAFKNCYGVHSGGLFKNGKWDGKSYFTPSNNLPTQ